VDFKFKTPLRGGRRRARTATCWNDRVAII